MWSVGHRFSNGLKQGNPLHNFTNHSQLPNNFYFTIIFGFTFSSYQGPQSWYLIIFIGLGNKRWVYLGGSVVHWVRYGPKQRNPLQNLKITHNYLILLFYYHFWVHFLIISRSTEFIFYYIEFFWNKRLGSLWKMLDIVEATAWSRGIPCKILKSLTTT